MTEVKQITEWRSYVEYSPDGPKHHVLADTGSYRAVLVGIDAGGKIPPHPSTDATYHFLEGSGWMIVDGERFPVSAGTTIVVPAKASRGIEANTRLAFLGSHGGHGRESGHQAAPNAPNSRRPLVMLGLMALSMLIVMVGIWQIAGSPMAMMLSSFGSIGWGAFGTMLLPMLGLLGMSVMMFVMYRKMSSMGSGMQQHDHAAMMAEKKPDSKSAGEQKVSYSIPGISCGGCKETIERELRELEGVASVQVDVSRRLASIGYGVPATETAIKDRLEQIGYPVSPN